MDDKFVLNDEQKQGSLLIKSYVNHAKGLIVYKYYENGDWLTFTYLCYTDEKAKELLEAEGIETYDSGQGTLGVKRPGVGATILFGAGKHLIDKIIEEHRAKKAAELFEQRERELPDSTPMNNLLAIIFLVVIPVIIFYIIAST